jgi:RNA polymerase sigma-70 factor (ECF subfamily)
MNRITGRGFDLSAGKNSSGFSLPEIRSLLEAPLSGPENTETPPKPDFPKLGRIDPDHIEKEAFLAGSDEAFVRLYAKYEVSLFYYCKRMLHDEAAAEDAFQEIWTRVFELRKRKDHPAIVHFRGLLFHSARNLCLNVLQNGHIAESIEARSEEPEFDEREEFSVAEPMTGVASGREIEALMVRALARLPFDQRETFVLHEYSGFSYPEIAEMMNVPERNVKVRAHRARIRLRKFIQGWLGLGEADDPVSYI